MFLVSSSSLSIYKKDDIYSAKTSCTFAKFWKLLQEIYNTYLHSSNHQNWKKKKNLSLNNRENHLFLK